MRAELPPQQFRIADRAKQGWTNEQIAAELGISINTVKMHMLLIFRRLSIKSRQDLQDFEIIQKE